jgi:hypothetical protein
VVGVGVVDEAALGVGEITSMGTRGPSPKKLTGWL